LKVFIEHSIRKKLKILHFSIFTIKSVFK